MVAHNFAVAIVLASGVVFAQVVDLPRGANVLEVCELPKLARANRALILWMINPQKHPWHDENEPYTCPDETRGSFYRGPARVSLTNTVTKTIVNTVEIKTELTGGWKDELDIPYWIHRSYYRVDPPFKGAEGRPVILDLKDYNGDGKALEFALFDAHSCSELQTQLIGYSERRDRVIQFPIHVKGKHYDHNPGLLWLDRFLFQKPLRPGYWKYEISYNNGDNVEFTIRYNRAKEMFVGTVK
ncbi:MAG: hypothetical protein HYZ37_18715 [Candidatus Solibacter usitatus]|nr:hypothetical protein [Candidatus Solibacter usitatus]